MVMIGDIYVNTSWIINVMNSFDQAVLFKCRDCSVNSIQ